MHGWRCEGCDGETRRSRGNCGGPITLAASGAQMDADGRAYIPGYIVAPGCDDRLSEDRFYACPLSEIVRPGSPIQEVITVHRRKAASGASISDLISSPTPAMLDALVELDATVSAFRAEKRRRAEEEMARKVEGRRRHG